MAWPTGQDVTSPSAPPRFSVLLATYNHARFLPHALASVEAQEWGDFEIVVINDGSSDGTREWLDQWESGFRERRSNRLTVRHVPNGGQSAAIEVGLGHCRGTYVALLDSDDRWLPGKLAAVQRVTMDHPECGLIVHPQLVIDPNGVRTGDVRPKGARLSHGDLRAQMRLTGRHVAGATSCHTYRRDVLDRLLPLPTREFRSAADQFLSFGASTLEPVFALEEPLSEYRVHPDGHYIQRMTSPEGIARQVQLQRTIAEHFGLGHVIGRNSFFARNSFAAAKLSGRIGDQWRAYRTLVRAIWSDAAFDSRQKVALSGFWGLGLLLPSAAFLAQWRWFQRVQTGRQRGMTRTS